MPEEGGQNSVQPGVQRQAARLQAADVAPVQPLKPEERLRSLLAMMCHWFLLTFAGLQDAVLAIGCLRRMVAFALLPRCRAAVKRQLLPPARNRATFENINYHVDAEAQKLLLHGGLHGLVHHPEAMVDPLPAVGRILLQTGARGTGKLQAAVAAAIANQLGASLLVVDDALLRAVSKASLGGEALGGDGLSGGLLTLPLSLFLSGGRLAFVWDIVAQLCSSVDGSLVVLVKDAEQTLCGSYERWWAFESAMGSGSSDSESSAGLVRRPLVLIGGCGVIDKRVAAQNSNSGGGSNEDDPDAEDKPSNPFPAHHDDQLADLLPSMHLTAPESRPNPHRVLDGLFPTRVKLRPPSDTAAAARHMQQLQQDAASAAVEHNYRALSSIATTRNLIIPPASAALYAETRLTPAAWAKVLAWATSLEAARMRALDPQAAEAQSQTAAASGAAPNAALAAKGDGGTGEAALVSPAAVRGALRRCMSASSATGEWLLHSLSGGSQPPSPRNRAGAAPEVSSPAAAKTLLSSLAARLSALSQGPSAVNDAARSGQPLPDAQRTLQQSSGTDAATSKRSNASSAQPVTASVVAVRGSPKGLVVSEQALRYGRAMLQQTGSASRQHVAPDNAFERRLLTDVIRPEDAGGGFRDVGALGPAKDALREAVQLPLQHPQLFSYGSLARPCKGVLLFGPPGTGKTLLARAAAAECGAAFLAVSPSTVASKWIGDGVRYMRALFSLAAKLSPCVIFVDEVDAMLGRRNSRTEHEVVREMKNEFMTQWEGIRSGSAAAANAGPRVMVLGATNRPGDLDEAVLRRFSRRLFCDLPDMAARAAILDVILQTEKVADDVDTAVIAAQVEGFSGSDLRQLCVAAAMRPVRELLAASGKSAAVASSGKRGRKAPGNGKDSKKQHRSKKAAAMAATPTEQQAQSSAADSSSLASQPQPSSGAAAQQLPSELGSQSAAAPVAAEPRQDGTTECGGARGSDGSSAADGVGPTIALAPARTEASDDAAAAAADDRSTVSNHTQAAAPASADATEVALLGRLLSECEAMTEQAAVAAPAALRPINAADFEAAQKEVAPSVSPDSGIMEELRQWDSTYGDACGNKRSTWDPKLSYFM